MARTLSTSPRSTATAVAEPPAARISSVTALAPSRLRSATTVCAPSAARRRAVAAPMPDAAPVTTAILSSSRGMAEPPFLFGELTAYDRHERDALAGSAAEVMGEGERA